MPTKRLQVVVIGLGPFGLTVCGALHQLGHEVMAVDPRDEAVLEAVDAGVATHAVRADPESLAALRELDVASADVVIVARGTDFEASLTTVLNLLELGVRQIVAKAINDRHATLLARVGGEKLRVVNPEHDMGLRLAHQLVGTDIMEAVWIDPDYSFVEKPLPAALAGKTIAESEVRGRFGALVVAVRRGDRLLIAPEPAFRLEAGDRVVLLGRNERLASFGR